MSKLQLSVAVGNYDRVRPLMERFGTSTKEAFRHVLAVRKKWRA